MPPAHPPQGLWASSRTRSVPGLLEPPRPGPSAADRRAVCDPLAHKRARSAWFCPWKTAGRCGQGPSSGARRSSCRALAEVLAACRHLSPAEQSGAACPHPRLPPMCCVSASGGTQALRRQDLPTRARPRWALSTNLHPGPEPAASSCGSGGSLHTRDPGRAAENKGFPGESLSLRFIKSRQRLGGEQPENWLRRKERVEGVQGPCRSRPSYRPCPREARGWLLPRHCPCASRPCPLSGTQAPSTRARA